MRLPKLTGALSATIICGSCSNSASQISDARPAARAMIEGYFTNVSITSDSATRSSSCADPCASALLGLESWRDRPAREPAADFDGESDSGRPWCSL